MRTGQAGIFVQPLRREGFKVIVYDFSIILILKYLLLIVSFLSVAGKKNGSLSAPVFVPLPRPFAFRQGWFRQRSIEEYALLTNASISLDLEQIWLPALTVRTF